MNSSSSNINYNTASIEHVAAATYHGTTYHPGQCAYFAPESPEEPYYIGRILEVGLAPVDAFGRAPAPGSISLRVSWFSRQAGESLATSSSHGKRVLKQAADVHAAASTSSMPNPAYCLMASMSTDWVPLSSVRGKCTVVHVSQLPPHLCGADPDGTKRQAARASHTWFYWQCKRVIPSCSLPSSHKHSNAKARHNSSRRRPKHT
jgi:hypothetical protein